MAFGDYYIVQSQLLSGTHMSRTSASHSFVAFVPNGTQVRQISKRSQGGRCKVAWGHTEGWVFDNDLIIKNNKQQPY